MKKQILLSAFIFFSTFGNSQNIPQCDSLTINCCDFDTAGSNTLTIYVSNPSTVLFNYPGFALLDANFDTIARETVNYFGIGSYPQAHTMQIVAPLNLPFAGYLDLYVLFYDTLTCRFAFTIADTASGIQTMDVNLNISVYPNPAIDDITIELDGFIAEKNLSLSVFDMLGNEVQNVPYDHSPLRLSLRERNAGIYFLRISDPENDFQRLSLLVHQ